MEESFRPLLQLTIIKVKSCIMVETYQATTSGRSKRNIPLTFFQNELMRRNNEFTYEV
jgi:hypothetical protein